METQIKEKALVEICNHCGVNVSFGSGRYVNRIPDFNDIETRKDNNLDFPTGDFVCEQCDLNSITGNHND